MKSCHGVKIVALVTGLITSLCACNHQPEKYQIRIKNNYFEKVGYVSIGEVYWESIDLDSLSSVKVIDEGNYVFIAKTQSGLWIKANLQVTGRKTNKILVIDNDGHVHDE